MKDIQEVFNQIQIVKKQQREIKSVFREALLGSTEHKELTEQAKVLKEKKKQVETALEEEFSSELDKLDELKIELESQNLMLNDIALTKIMKGESIELVDQYNNAFEPIFSVKFKKTNVINNTENVVVKDEEGSRINPQLSILDINHSLE